MNVFEPNTLAMAVGTRYCAICKKCEKSGAESEIILHFGYDRGPFLVIHSLLKNDSTLCDKPENYEKSIFQKTSHNSQS